MTAAAERSAILFAVPGTSYPEAAADYDPIDRAAERRFPKVERRWAYTSAPIRRKLAAQGSPAAGPAEALAALAQAGATRVAVVSLHMTDGKEYRELAAVVEDLRRAPQGAPRARLGPALMSCESDWERAVRALLAALPETPGQGDRVVLVAHGSLERHAVRTLRAAAEIGARIDRRLSLAMMLGTPGLEETIAACRAAAPPRVWLVPCLVAAGYSVREEIAGTGEKSWRTAFERAGIACAPVVKGLGEVAGVVDLWMNQAGRLLDELAG